MNLQIHGMGWGSDSSPKRSCGSVRQIGCSWTVGICWGNCLLVYCYVLSFYIISNKAIIAVIEV